MTDPAKLAAWFEAHAAVLVLYARQWLDRVRAEDVVQEAFVRLMGQVTEPGNVRAWLHATVRNAAIDEARAATRRRARENSKATNTPEWFDPQPTDVINADSVQRAVAKLPPRQREIVMLRIWSEMTLTEIAKVTQLAISTVHGDYRRGLDAIRNDGEPMQGNDERIDELTPAHRELEDAMRGLSPASVNISRDRLMFQAGAMIGRRSASRWRNAAAALVLVNVGLIAFSTRSPRKEDYLQVAQIPIPTTESREVSSDFPETKWAKPRAASQLRLSQSAEDYVALRNEVLRHGLSVLPVSSAQLSSEKPITVDRLLETSPAEREPASSWSPLPASIRTFLFSGDNL